METIKYLSAQEVSDAWGITKRRVQNLCVNKRVPGAIRIGNMWAIPANTSKPNDARMREHTNVITPPGAQIRNARKALKKIVEITIKELQESSLSPAEALKVLVVSFSSKLLEIYIDDYEACLDACEHLFGYEISNSVSEQTTRSIEKYISENRMYLDDSLSWVYQFGSKKLNESIYKNTQFFTEKYMITTLVDALHLDMHSKIIDPACGGGNFLIYAFEILVDKTAGNDSNIEKAKYVLDNLCGYEIDRFLAYVASFNLKMKALSMISKEQAVSIDLFNAFHTKIFYPKTDSILGFLDIDWDKQLVVNCDSGCVIRLVDAFEGTNIAVTNPPFQTIKGMSSEQKEYLHKHYPMSMCDMCNSFIERVMEVLPTNGEAAMVTQNSWMYLHSFTPLRSRLLKDYTINDIWELGSNAFYNLSGEKANVALVTFTKKMLSSNHKINLYYLRNMEIEQIESILRHKASQPLSVKQQNILKNTESRFDMVSTEHLKYLQANCKQYKDFAVPMQGTSTGDAKNLIDYYWRHIGDKNWILVSKGGGYSRFEGLNSYCVKWGKDGEYIKNTKGSAIRNANYFNQTQLAFSDTGTAGLNARVLLPGQIFVASGPGIRINRGKKLSHLAFLNSRFAAFYVRLTSPKLTVAAGYIGQIPVTAEILNSSTLEKCARQCLKSKSRRLSKRPNNIEFSYIKHTEGISISDMAHTWFTEDINDEWTQLLNEQQIEDKISKEMKLTAEDWQAIDKYIGSRIILSHGNTYNEISINKSDISKILGFDCFPRRTKANKQSLGSDGLIEYISQSKGIPCEEVYSIILERYEWFEESYLNLYMHALVLSATKYRDKMTVDVSVDSLLSEIGILSNEDSVFLQAWLKTHFNDVHSGLFDGKPLLKYEPAKKIISWVKE